MKKLILSILVSLFSLNAISQTLLQRCVTDQQMQHLFKQNPAAKIRYEAYQKSINSQLREMQNDQIIEGIFRTNAIVTIPVVVHILTSNPDVVTNDVIQKQIDTLNWYYGGQAANDSLRVYEPFRTRFGRSQIRFCLAKRDPMDQPSTGVTRRSNTSTFDRFSNDMKNTSAGGQTAWDTKRYLNMWVVQYNDGTLGGAYLPGAFAPGDGNIGFVVDYRAFGSGATYLYREYSGGKTAVHEIGHFLNLLHPWGQQNNNPSCSNDDFVGDTPLTTGPSFGCPTFPASDACAGINGKMAQNHMDYADDACMVLFTQQQVNRMEVALNTSPDRVTLLTSNGCSIPPVVSRNIAPIVFISPDSIFCDATSVRPVVQVKNLGTDTIKNFTVTYSINAGAATTISYSGALPFLQNVNVTLNNTNLNVGVNILKLYTSNPNGAFDQEPKNDTLVYTIRVLATVNDSLIEGFEGVFPPNNWAIRQQPKDDVTWAKTLKGFNSNASAFINNYNYAANGRIDDLITPPIKYSGADSILLSFDLSAVTYSFPGSTVIPLDTLEILATTDCGKNFTSVYKKFGFNLQTIGDPNSVYTTEFFPQGISQWRRDSINLTNLFGSANTVQFAFRNTTNFENNIFVDNVNFRKKVLPARLKATGILISPNPFKDQFVLQHYLQPTDLKQYVIYNAVGQKVLQQSFTSGTAQSLMVVRLNNQPAGVYTIRLIYTSRTESYKLVKVQ